MDAPEEDGLDIFFQMLREEISSEDFQIALQTLLKIHRNVQANPNEAKYKTLKKDNKTFNQKLWRFSGAQQLLFAVGWMEVDDAIVLPDDSLVPTVISEAEKLLRSNGPAASVAAQDQQASWTNREVTEKERVITEERKRLAEQIQRDKRERERVRAQIKADREETDKRESKDSQARQLKFGSNMKTFKDVGVDLNRGGG